MSPAVEVPTDGTADLFLDLRSAMEFAAIDVSCAAEAEVCCVLKALFALFKNFLTEARARFISNRENSKTR